MNKLTKEQVKNYLTSGDNWDVTEDQLIDDLKVSEDEVEKLHQFLQELEDEDWIKKSEVGDGDDEYDPGEKTGFWH